ncbi:DUF2127 domain-containing protein [Patescibacteria group bacterium]|nr:MAG: DUF2127 domain-containing protein [Patescibacteria group bacterium]
MSACFKPWYNFYMAITEKSIHRIFFISLILKGLNALLEILGGILFLFSGVFSKILLLLIKGELIEDPTDFFANHFSKLVPYLSVHTELFASFYLLSHGIIKIILVVNLLRNKAWAYPVTIGVLGLFVAYQIYYFTYHHFLFLILLTLLDVILMYLTWHEYRLLKKHIQLK